MKSSNKLGFLIVLTAVQLVFLHYLYHYMFKNRHQGITLIDSENVNTANYNNHHGLVLKALASEDRETTSDDVCSVYFDGLLRLDANLTLIDPKLAPLRYEPRLDSMSSHAFLESELQRLKQVYKATNKDIAEIDSGSLLKSINSQLETNKRFRLELTNAMGILRAYNRCSPTLSHDRCLEIETRLYPWFTFELPVYTRWDGTTLSKKFPHIEYMQDAKFKVAQRTPADLACFWNDIESKYNGNGIVIPVQSERDFKYTLKLIKVLRLLQNKLPLQIVYNYKYFQLTPEMSAQIVAVSRDIITLEDSTVSIKDHKQETWFVEVSNVISDEFMPMHKNTLITLATLFNSFRTAIVMSPDSTPFMNLSQFIEELSELQDTGLYLFKARTTGDRLSDNYSKLVSAMLPSALETLFFPLDQDKHPSSPPPNTYLDPKHASLFTDPRLFVITKSHAKIHALLTSVHLQLTTQIHSAELHWLSNYLHGSSYTHSSNAPGAIGVPTHNHIEQPMIASKQSAHLRSAAAGNNDKATSNQGVGQILWVSDGLYHCDEILTHDEFELLEAEAKKSKSKSSRAGFLGGGEITSEQELRDRYRSVVEPQAVIVPPVSSQQKGWELTKFCNSHVYKANQHVPIEDADGLDAGFESGLIIRFNSEQLHHYNGIIHVWNADFKTSKLELS